MAAIHFDKLEEIKKDYEDGLSVREIAEKFDVSVKAAFCFFKRHNIPRRQARESNQFLFARKEPSFKLKENLNSEEEKLKIAGLMLYWGEGAKSGSEVDFSNSDAEMIKIFLLFLRNVCGVKEQRLRVFLYCYANQDLKELMYFWSGITGISLDNFTKPYVRNDFKEEKIGKMKYGLIHIRYGDKKLLNYVLQEIDKYKEKLTWVGTKVVNWVAL